jgi:hypothetical protein
MSLSSRYKGVGVWQGVDLREQQLQRGHELRAGHFAVGLAPGGELKDEHQQAVEQEHGQLVPAFFGVSRIGNGRQLREHGGQLLAQEAHLLADGVLAGLFFFGNGHQGRASVRQGNGRMGNLSRCAQFQVQRLFLPLLCRAQTLDGGACRATARFAHGRELPGMAHSRSRLSAQSGLTHTWRGVL